MNKKAVFFDIDGTLWRRGLPVPDSAVSAIRKLREEGHFVFLNSGRSKAHIYNKRLLEIGWDGIISGLGTHVMYGDKVLYSILLSQTEWNRIIDLSADCGVRMIIEGENNLYFDDEDYQDDPYGQKLMRELGSIRKHIKGQNEDFIAGKFSVDIDEDADRERWFDGLKERYRFIRHSDKIFEVVPLGHDKATGMAIAADYLGIDRSDTIAFGDSINDKDMLQNAGVGIALGNSIEKIKEIADLVTDNVEDDGVRNALLKLGLI